MFSPLSPPVPFAIFMRLASLTRRTFNSGLRIVVELESHCPFFDEASIFAPDGRNVVYPQHLYRNINSILFYCASKPGLSRVLMELYNFQGVAIRCRSAAQLRGGPQHQVRGDGGDG